MFQAVKNLTVEGQLRKNPRVKYYFYEKPLLLNSLWQVVGGKIWYIHSGTYTAGSNQGVPGKEIDLESTHGRYFINPRTGLDHVCHSTPPT